MKQRLTEQLLPYFVLGIAIALLIGVCIILSYLLLWGVLIGALLWTVAWLKQHFSKKTKLSHHKTGRIIEYHDIKTKK